MLVLFYYSQILFKWLKNSSQLEPYLLNDDLLLSV